MNPIADCPRFSIGQQFTPIGKAKRVYTIRDILRTYNHSGQLVRIRYLATCEFMGQVLTDYDVNETTIARGIANQ
jgi:hypothetical protein